jgi:hypothetical protein
MRRPSFVSALTLALGVAIGIIGQQNTNAQTPDSRVADLVRAGKLRVGVGVVAPHWAIKDPQANCGPWQWTSLAPTQRALKLSWSQRNIRAPAVLGGVKDSAWDVGFVAIDPLPRDCRLLSPVSERAGVRGVQVAPPGNTGTQ